MSLNNGEATDVNVVVRYLTEQPAPSGRAVEQAEAVEALARLADKAYKHLMAGLRGQDVRAGWRAGR